MNIIDDDNIDQMFITSTHNFIMFFTNQGRVYRLKGYEIPEAGRTARGVNIINLLQLQPEERVTAIVPVQEEEGKNYLVMATRRGIIKKDKAGRISEYKKDRTGSHHAREGDELIEVKQAGDEDDIFLVTKEGQCIRFALKNVREIGRVSIGVIGINLGDADEVVAMQISSEARICLLCQKKAWAEDASVRIQRCKTAAGKGLRCYRITEKTGYVVGAKIVNGDEEIMMITTEGIVIRMESETISVIGETLLV